MTLRSLLAATAASLALVPAVGLGAAYAQETAAGVRGTVTTEAGAPIAGADVVVTDTRTNQSRRVTTDDDGRFRVQGLPAGGPYTISAAETGYQGERVEGVTLLLGDTANLTFELDTSDVGAADEIVVVGTRQVIGTVAPGPSITFTAEDLASLPTVTRDIKDIIELDPRVYIDRTFGDGIYCVGSSNRSNSLTVDGYNLNDNFGLNANGYPTQRLPFPYDVTEQVSVEFAPFDVEYGGFTGCNINVVTRTGTNEFHGRAVFDFSNGDLRGESLEGEEFPAPDIDEYSYGGYLSGPILPDRLFFTLGYEKFEGADISTTSFAGSGFANEIASITGDDVSRIQQVLADVYGFDAGGVPDGLDVEDERFFGKIDGFVTDRQRFEISAQHTKGNSISIQNTSFRNEELGLSSNYYDRSEELTVVSGRLFSDWTDKLSTELRVSYQDRTTGQESLGGTDFAQLEIETPGGGSVFVGPDVFRQANRLEQEAFNAKVKADYAIGEHLITAGYEFDRNEVFNLFVAFSEGEALFANAFDDLDGDGEAELVSSGIDALAAQQPTQLFYVNTLNNQKEEGAADFATDRHTFYVQDVWAATPDLEITAGLRVDAWSQDERPGYNPAFQARYGIRNDDNLEGKTLIQPRVAFDWVANDRLSVTGGVGLFSGGEPAVWVSNNFTGTGVLLGSAFSSDADELEGFDGFNIPDSLLEANTEAVRNADGFVNALDPDYELPSVLRFSLGAAYDLDLGRFGEGYRVGADILYGITYDPNEWRALNAQVVGTGPDGRPLYAAVDLLDADCRGLTFQPGDGFDRDYLIRADRDDVDQDDGACPQRLGGSGDSDFLLTNSDEEPTQLVLSGFVEKEWEIGQNTIGTFLGYAYTDAEDVNPGTSSRAISNFENFSVADLNFSRPATSNYVIPHRFTARLDLRREWAEGWITNAAFRGALQQGRPYSHNWDAQRSQDGFPNEFNVFGDTDASEDRGLIYVPNSAGDPALDIEGSNPTALQDYLEFFSDSRFSEYRGGILPRNAFHSDWNGQVDLRLSQTIPLPKTLGDDRLRLLLDIDNLTNLIDDDWGVYREYGFEYNVPVATATLTEDGYAIQQFQEQDQRVNLGASLWRIQIGARYDF